MRMLFPLQLQIGLSEIILVYEEVQNCCKGVTLLAVTLFAVNHIVGILSKHHDGCDIKLYYNMGIQISKLATIDCPLKPLRACFIGRNVPYNVFNKIQAMLFLQ